MHRIDSATARHNLNGVGKNGFHDNADLPNQDATYLTPEWCNSIQEEVANVIEGFGGALDKLDNKQLLNILTATFAKNTALQNAVDDYSDKFAQQGSRILAVENRIYEDTKVGDVFVTTTHFDTSAQVAIHKGYGTWAREAEGRAIVGYSSQADSPEWTKTNGSTFGEYDHQLRMDEMPKHHHSQDDIFNRFMARGDAVEGAGGLTTTSSISPQHDDNNNGSEIVTTGLTNAAWNKQIEQSMGADNSHNNVQPSKVFNVWRRIA